MTDTLRLGEPEVEREFGFRTTSPCGNYWSWSGGRRTGALVHAEEAIFWVRFGTGPRRLRYQAWRGAFLAEGRRLHRLSAPAVCLDLTAISLIDQQRQLALAAILHPGVRLFVRMDLYGPRDHGS